jgi:hypothetical protein
MKTAMQELMELNDFLKIMGVTIEYYNQTYNQNI